MEESLSSCEIFEKILKSLISYEQSPSTKADVAKLEFSNFLSTAVKNKDFFVNFDKETNRVDTSIFSWYQPIYHVTSGAQNVYNFLFHGQTTVERGFSKFENQ